MQLLCEQTVLLLGQAANSVSYLRRKNLLANITSEKTAKSLLTSHKDLFEEKDPYHKIIPEKGWDKISEASNEVERAVKAVSRVATMRPFFPIFLGLKLKSCET